MCLSKLKYSPKKKVKSLDGNFLSYNPRKDILRWFIKKKTIFRKEYPLKRDNIFSYVLTVDYKNV